MPPRKLRRSSREWATRSVIALAGLAMAYYAGTHSIAQAVRHKAPETAYGLAPYDGRTIAAMSAKKVGPSATSSDRTEGDRLARLALRRDPTAVAAVATLGLNAQLRGDTEIARRYFDYSNRLSRRDLGTRLWLIEDAVEREDIAAALRHYDIALRTSRSAPTLLYPVLASAVSDNIIRDELVRTLASKPAWTESFLTFVAGESTTLAAASLFQKLRAVRVAVPDAARARVVNRLVDEKNYPAAWTYYASTRANADRRRSRDASFAADLTDPTPFDWVPMGGNSGISTAIQGGSQDGIFDFSAPSSVGGPLIQQLQLLPAGEYVIEGQTFELDQSENSQPYWSLVCVDDVELGRFALPNSSENGGKFRSVLRVPPSCPAQYLRLVARPSNAVGGLKGQIDDIQLRPAG